MTCAVPGCERQTRPNWGLCDTDAESLLSAAFGFQPEKVEPIERLSLTLLPPTPRGAARPVDPPPTAGAPLPRQPEPPSTAPAA